MSKKVVSVLLSAVMLQSALTIGSVVTAGATESSRSVAESQAVSGVNLSQTTLSLKVGSMYTLTAKNGAGQTLTCTWKSNNAGVATVNSKGRVVARGEGTANVTAISSDGQKAVCAVTVRPQTVITLNKISLGLFVKETAVLTATVTNNDEPVTVTFKSSNANVATVNSQGRVVARGVGTANITAISSDGQKAVCAVTVKQQPTVSLNRTTLELRKKEMYTLKATLTPSDAETEITFKSSNPDVVTVNASGRVVARGVGTATVKAVTKGGASAVCQVTVKQSDVDEVIALVNSERAKEGLPALEKREDVCALADIRAQELTESFSHTRPDGRSCFSIFSDYNVNDWSTIGENIAYGQSSPTAVMNSWMNSKSHRENIMNEDFTGIGIGVYQQDGRKYWVQLFIG